jgi:hypothetical protein
VDPGRPEVCAKMADGFVQGVPACRFFDFRPEKTEQVLATAGSVRREREIDQNREMFAPEHLRRRRSPCNTSYWRAETDEFERGSAGNFG